MSVIDFKECIYTLLCLHYCVHMRLVAFSGTNFFRCLLINVHCLLIHRLHDYLVGGGTVSCKRSLKICFRNSRETKTPSMTQAKNIIMKTIT